jgi:hypothetical protein
LLVQRRAVKCRSEDFEDAWLAESNTRRITSAQSNYQILVQG